MPRPPKNPDHPLTRLRKLLSTTDLEMTRLMFAKRFGIPLESLKAIERGTYLLTVKTAQRIEAVVGVSAGSLLMGEGILKAWDGTAFTAKTRPAAGGSLDDCSAKRALALLSCAIQASRGTGAGTNHSMEFYILLVQWISQTMGTLQAEAHFWRLVFENWLEPNPDRKLLHLLSPHSRERRDAFNAAWIRRANRFKSERVTLLCEQLDAPRQAKELCRYLNWCDAPNPKTDPTKYAKPEVAERVVGLHETATRIFAEKHGTVYDADHGWAQFELDAEVRIRLAIQDGQIQADDPTLQSIRQTIVARLQKTFFEASS